MAQPARPGGFDMRRVSTGSKILLITGLLLFIDLFLPWQRVCIDFGGFGGGCASVSGFSGLGILVAILLIGLLVWEGMLIAGVNVNMGTTSPAMISAIIAGAAALFTIILFLTRLQAIGFGAWIGLILALVLAYGAYVRFNESKVTTPPPAI
jgi:hypothetical protein